MPSAIPTLLNHPAWLDYRRRRNSFLGAVLAWVGLIGLALVVPDQSLLGQYWWLVALPIFAWFTAAGFRITWWHCPRCDQPYFTKGIWYGNLLVSRCYHCGLAKWADPECVPRGA
jgi:hypothetical protein